MNYTKRKLLSILANLLAIVSVAILPLSLAAFDIDRNPPFHYFGLPINTLFLGIAYFVAAVALLALLEKMRLGNRAFIRLTILIRIGGAVLLAGFLVAHIMYSGEVWWD